MQGLYHFTHLRFWALIINGLQRRFYTLPFFRYAATFFNGKNLMKNSDKNVAIFVGAVRFESNVTFSGLRNAE